MLRAAAAAVAATAAAPAPHARLIAAAAARLRRCDARAGVCGVAVPPATPSIVRVRAYVPCVLLRWWLALLSLDDRVAKHAFFLSPSVCVVAQTFATSKKAAPPAADAQLRFPGAPTAAFVTKLEIARSAAVASSFRVMDEAGRVLPDAIAPEVCVCHAADASVRSVSLSLCGTQRRMRGAAQGRDVAEDVQGHAYAQHHGHHFLRCATTGYTPLSVCVFSRLLSLTYVSQAAFRST